MPVIYFILRLIFFYILFLFVKSLLKSFFMNKVKAKFENLNSQQNGSFRSEDQQSPKTKKEKDSNVIEAEFRKL